MKICHIFCAGEFYGLAVPIRPGELVLGADGGLRHLEALGIVPDEILGDFDSLGYVPDSARVFPVEKDDTDAMLAVRRGLSLDCKRFYLYGAMDGARVDHTVANFQTLQFLADHGASGLLVGKDFFATVVKNGSLRFSGEAEGIVSVFCSGADARGVTLRGLKYPLTDSSLTPGFPLGVSNHFMGENAEITVREGSLLVLWQRSGGLPL